MPPTVSQKQGDFERDRPSIRISPDAENGEFTVKIAKSATSQYWLCKRESSTVDEHILLPATLVLALGFAIR